jgi:hypothetical protein
VKKKAKDSSETSVSGKKTVMTFQATGEYKISKVKFLRVSNHNWNTKPESQATVCNVVMVFVPGSETSCLASLKVKTNQETTNGDIQTADLYSVPMKNR